MTITGVNDTPTANDDTGAVSEDGPSTTIDVLADDTDPDGDPLTIASVSGGTGLVSIVDGKIEYDPNGQFESLKAGETTTDTFTYTINDGKGGTDTASVTVTITGVNDTPTATDDTGSVSEDGPATTIDVLADDTDPDGDPLTIASVSGGTGLVSIVDGKIDYDPNGQFESLKAGETTTDTFTYTINDGKGGTDTASVTVTITGVNDTPTATDDTGSVSEDGPSTTIDVFADDTDPDGDPLTIASVSGGTGLVSIVDGKIEYDPNGQFESLKAGETTSDTFTYTINDGKGGTDTASVTVTITGVNDTPTANDDTGSVSEDGPATTIDVLADDTDPDGDPLTIASVSGGTGLVSIVDGKIEYDPNGQFESLKAGETTTDTFTYTINDGKGGTDTASVTVTITGVNDTPTANDDTGSVSEDGPATTIDVLADDTDPDGDPLTIASVSGGTGLVSIVDGKIEYDPNGQFESLKAGETTSDTFTYTINDGKGGTDTASVTVTITGVNDTPIATDDTGAVSEDGPSTTIDVLADDTDPDGDPLTIASVSGGTGLVSIVDGKIEYDPNGQFESLKAGETTTDTFTYTINDGKGGTDTASVTVTITGVNDTPTANDDTGAVSEDGPSTTIDVLADDTDPDGDTLTIASVSGGTGLVSIVDGKIEYDPNGQFESLKAGETTTDTFTYTINDGKGGTDTASVTVTITGVNDTPTANDDTGAVSEDGPATTIGVLADDTDPDGDTLTIASVSGGTGLVSIVDGKIEYDPNGQFESLKAGETTTDTFTYTINDGKGGSDTASVTVTITGVNDTPTANDDTGAVSEDGPSTTIDVLADDTDPDGDPLTIASVSGGTGLVSIVDGKIEYDPNGQFESLKAGETTTDTFTYTINDGKGGTDTASVTVTITGVNDTPTATDDTGSVSEDGPATTIDVLADDTDPDGDPLTIASVSGGTGLVSIVDGKIDYDPNGQFESLKAGETTTDTFTYTINDGKGGTDTASVTVTITGVNDTPTANDDTGAVSEDGPATTIDVLADDTDPDGDPLTIASVSGGTGLVSIVDGKIEYDPNGQFESLKAGETTTDTFTYTINDGKGGTDTASVTVTITGVNDTPTANDDTGVRCPRTVPSTTIDVLADDTDPDGDPLTIASVSGGTGLVSIVDGKIEYDPNGQFESLKAGETTTDTFTYTINDGKGGTDTASVTVTITGVNDTPTANDDTGSVSEDGPATTIDVLADDTDPDGDPLTIASVSGGTGLVSIVDGKIEYDPNGQFESLKAGETTTDTFTYTINDGKGGTDTASVTVTITGVNDTPTANDDTGAVSEDGPATTIDVLSDDTDPDGDTLHDRIGLRRYRFGEHSRRKDRVRPERSIRITEGG